MCCIFIYNSSHDCMHGIIIVKNAVRFMCLVCYQLITFFIIDMETLQQDILILHALVATAPVTEQQNDSLSFLYAYSCFVHYDYASILKF
jgi:hypothetical protein